LTIFSDSTQYLRMPFPIIPGRVEFQNTPIPPEPGDIVAGDTLTWKRSFADYPASAGWTLAYVLNSPTARIVVNPVDVTPLGDAFSVQIPSSETTTWTPGTYQWLAVVQLAAADPVPAKRFTVALGRINIAVDILDASAPQDTRSVNEIALANIDAMLAGTASAGVQEYTISGRMLRRYGLPELRALRSDFASRVRQERADRGEYQRPRTVAVHF
jgi:hypothetical protein